MFLSADFPINEVDQVSKAITGFAGAVAHLFPGIPLRSIQNAEKKTTKVIAKDIERLQNLDIERSLKEILISSVIARHSRAANLIGVVNFASTEINPESSKHIIDNDWLNHFKNYAEKVETSDVQLIWGKILAGEINQPGSFSKRTLSILDDMNSEEAKLFSELCSICIGKESDTGDITYPISLLHLKKNFLKGLDLSLLRSLGLLQYSVGIYAPSCYFDTLKGAVIKIGDTRYFLKSSTNQGFSEGYIAFSKYGIELSSICQIGNALGYEDAALSYLQSKRLGKDQEPLRIYRISNWIDYNHFDKSRII